MGNAKLGMERSIEMPNAASAEASDSPKNPEYFRTARMGARVHDCRRQGDERDKRAAEREEEAVAGQQEHRPPKAPWRHAVQHDRNRQKGREEKGGIVRRH